MSRTIKEAEELTKVTSQNIRYYEKQGLLAPKRDKENSYRLYSEEEISRLKLIRLFRKLGMPIGEIRRMFEGDISLEEAIGDQISRLQSQKEELTAALEFCGRIKENQLADVDPDLYLEEMEQEEALRKKGRERKAQVQEKLAQNRERYPYVQKCAKLAESLLVQYLSLIHI